MTFRALTDGWTLRLLDPDAGMPPALAATLTAGVPASVPGVVHTDLLAAGLIPDPYLDRNEDQLGWIGRTSWRYATTLVPDPAARGAERVDLVCEGLDTVATPALDGRALGSTANQHRSYRFDLRPVLGPAGAPARGRPHDLTVEFGSAYAYTAARIAELGPRPSATPEPFNMIRKMACNFGWDWGPTLVTAGIWKPIGIDAWSTARLARVLPQAGVDGDGRPTVAVQVAVERSGVGEAGPLTVVAEVAGTRVVATIPSGGLGTTLELTVPQARLWWPHGYGDQPRYPLTVTLQARDGGPVEPLDRWTRPIGFRTVAIDTSRDEIGSRFVLVVNGREVFARGADWIPDDCFPHRVDRARYERRIRQGLDANIGFLRVWGGGLYESDDFYDVCDSLGVLVWQDFLFACAAYPEEEPFASEVEAEARENVVRLASHPSLAVWNGNNENIWAWWDWGWQQVLGDATWGKGFYLDLLPRIVAELDPTRPYFPGSPYSAGFDQYPNDDSDGVKHVWDVWNQVDYTAYRRYVPRFVSEFGFQGPATWATIRRAVSDPVLTPGSPTMLHHQKATGGQEKLARGMAPHLPAPRTGEHEFDDWLWLTQLNQARAVAFGIEHFRSHAPTCMGTAVWQLNDCWPVTSWAAIDGDGRRKPLWYAMRRAYRDRFVTVQPRGHGLAAILDNDSPQAWAGLMTFTRWAFDGTALAQGTAPVDLGARERTTVHLPAHLAVAEDPTSELLEVSVGGETALWFWAEDIDLKLPVPAADIVTTDIPGGVEVLISATTLLRDVALFPDRLDPDATVDDMLVTLLPGRSATFVVRSERPLDHEALTRPPVLRSVGDIHRLR